MRFSWIIVAAVVSGALAATYNVTNAPYNAVGDAVSFTCNTTSNSTTIAITSTPFSAGDIGKVVQLFDAGTFTDGTNHQDLLTTVSGVSGSNVTLAVAPGATLSGVIGTVGTDNRTAFQAVIDALDSTNDVVTIPAGRYLIVNPFRMTNGVMASEFDKHPSLTLMRGGVTFRGEHGTTLLASGAWADQPYVYRGYLFALGPVNDTWPVTFDSITFDGGVAQGLTSVLGWPANTTNGLGWDISHHAFVDVPPLPVHSLKTFTNCTFQHWRGEMIHSGVASTSGNGSVEIDSCTFYDGNASAFNYGLAHTITNSIFNTLELATEFYQGFPNQPSFFVNSTITNVINGLVIVGALTNHFEPLYTIQGNSMSASGYTMLMAPARNLLITSNTFYGNGFTTSGASVQGTDLNADWIVSGNTFTNVTGWVFVNASYITDATSNIVFSANKSYGAQVFASGYGKNLGVTFSSNVMNGINPRPFDSQSLGGLWFYDDGSNSYDLPVTPGIQNGTNTVSYSIGANQRTISNLSPTTFALDDSSPTSIPPGATLSISHTGTQPATVLTSTANSPLRLGIASGQTLIFFWRYGRWKDSRTSYIGTARVGQIKGP